VTYEDLALCSPDFNPYVFDMEQGNLLYILEIKYEQQKVERFRHSSVCLYTRYISKFKKRYMQSREN